MNDDPMAALREIAKSLQTIVLAEIYERVAPVSMLAHYTSLEAFTSILRSKEIWFSRVQDMNDTSEISGGASIVAAALAEHGPGAFRTVPYADLEVEEQFEARKSILQSDTYVFSLSEHGGDEQSDRLVMWRAYGRDGNGLCLVLRKAALLGQSANGRFPVHWTPTEYESADQLKKRVQRRLTQIDDVFNACSQTVLRVPPKALGSLVASCAVPLVLGHKHLAFRDEHEVRFVRSRLLQPLVPPEGSSYRNAGSPVPRDVFVLPLRNYPEFSVNASPTQLLDHVIVGPSQQQKELHTDVRKLLDANNLSHVHVLRSNIPYRASR